MRRFVALRKTERDGKSMMRVLAWGMQWPPGDVSFRTAEGLVCSAASMDAAARTLPGCTLQWLDSEIDAARWNLFDDEMRT